MVRFRSVECKIFQPKEVTRPDSDQPTDPQNESDDHTWVWAPERFVNDIPRGTETDIEVHEGHFGVKFYWHSYVTKRVHIYISMDGRVYEYWNDTANMNPAYRLWESQMMKGIEYNNSRNKLCIRRFAFTPITEFELNNKDWEGYDQGGTITIKIYRAALRSLEKLKNIKVTKAHQRKWDEVPSVSAVDVDRDCVSHLVTLDPEELIPELGGSILETAEKHRYYTVVDIPEVDGKPYATFKFNFRSPAVLQEDYVSLIKIPRAEIKKWVKDERDIQLGYLRTEIDKFKSMIIGVIEDQERVALNGGGAELDGPLDGAEIALERLEERYEKLKYERPVGKRAKRKADQLENSAFHILLSKAASQHLLPNDSISSRYVAWN